MKTASETVLCYGFPIQHPEGEDETDFEHFLAKLAGFEKPDERVDNEKFQSDQSYRKAWEAYWTEKYHVIQGHEVAVVRYGSREHTRYILAAKASILEVVNGEPIATKKLLATLIESRKEICIFCENAGIKFQEPELIICSFN